MASVQVAVTDGGGAPLPALVMKACTLVGEMAASSPPTPKPPAPASPKAPVREPNVPPPEKEPRKPPPPMKEPAAEPPPLKEPPPEHEPGTVPPTFEDPPAPDANPIDPRVF